VAEIVQFAWKRFSLLTTIVGEYQGRFIVTAFYYTIFVPFGLGSRLFTDPLQRKETPRWEDRPPVPTDLDSAKQQG
jgi:hypothetical protein